MGFIGSSGCDDFRQFKPEKGAEVAGMRQCPTPSLQGVIDQQYKPIGEGTRDRADLAFNGIVAEILVPILSGRPDGFKDGRDVMSTTIRSLPGDLISEESAAAVTHFISALPNPQGKWTLTFQSQGSADLGAQRAEFS